MKSFLPWLLGAYLIWLFIVKEPGGSVSWAKVMGGYLMKRDACAAAQPQTTGTNKQTPASSPSTSKAAG